MSTLFKHIRLVLIACTALALSAGLVFGATPPAASSGLSNAAAHAGKTVPVVVEDETAGGDESAEEQNETETAEETTEETTEETSESESETEDVQDAEDASTNCTVDPTAATPEDLAAMNHGAVVCWAAQQTEWPEWFANHGAFVRCWAHQGKADAASCTEDPSTVDETTDGSTDAVLPTAHGKSHGHGKAKGKAKHFG